MLGLTAGFRTGAVSASGEQKAETNHPQPSPIPARSCGGHTAISRCVSHGERSPWETHRDATMGTGGNRAERWRVARSPLIASRSVFGLRQSSAAVALAELSESGRGLPQSKTLRDVGRLSQRHA
jgi:hypothetical protein